MPTWMQYVSRVNPISYAVNGVRDLSIPGFFSWSAEVAALAFIAGIAIVTIGITLYLFRKVVS
jgi:ABC-type multidrug transport system permease subunit